MSMNKKKKKKTCSQGLRVSNFKGQELVDSHGLVIACDKWLDPVYLP